MKSTTGIQFCFKNTMRNIIHVYLHYYSDDDNKALLLLTAVDRRTTPPLSSSFGGISRQSSTPQPFLKTLEQEFAHMD